MNQGSELDPFPYPRGLVIGAVSDDAALERSREALSRAGVQGDRIEVLHGEADADRLDVEGEAHGVVGRLVRALQKISDVELDHLHRHAAMLRSGRYLVGVEIAGEEGDKQRAVDALRAADAEFINYYHERYVESFEGR